MEINPWVEISFEKRVLAIDDHIISEYNKKNEERQDRIISSEYFPEPFIGSPDAGIYLLLGNPGMETDTAERKKIISNIDKYAEYYLCNLRHEAKNPNYPLFYLDPSFKGDEGGKKWWEKSLKSLKKDAVTTIEKIAKEIFVAETCGYHSAKGETIFGRFKSREYTQHLIINAINDQKPILVARSVRQWFNLVPELKEYENTHFVASNRGIDLSATTISPKAFHKIKEILR